VIFFAPAKVNLCLHVNAKRSDGYHDLCMIMQKISLCDELCIEVAKTSGVTFSCAGTDLGAHQDNLVVRAAHAMLKYAPAGCGVDIALKKNIPVAAGLGGGSSDAATTLLALNKLLGLDLEEKILHREALALGADVPFFLYDSVAWATGIGDQFQPLKIRPQFWLVLINPGCSVSTAEVYGVLKPTHYSSCHIVPVVDSELELLALLHNDLESATIDLCPVVELLKRELVRFGAAGVLMSGSGPTVFGLFFEEQAALKARQMVLESGVSWSCVASPF